jgi:NTP pyrophosphatase (non-canonical NTP hydrolase)
MIKELGDVLWYLAALATELKVDLAEVAEKNFHKVTDRKARGVTSGEGDNR